MIHVENDYEPLIYEQPIHSHIYENRTHFLLNHYTRPINSNKIIERIVDEITEKKPVNYIYKNIPKKPTRERIWTIPLLLESPKSKEFQPPNLEIGFLIDSGAESNIMNNSTWNKKNYIQN